MSASFFNSVVGLDADRRVISIGDARQRRVLLLMFGIAAVLHVGLWYWLRRPLMQESPPPPQIIQVSMVTIPSPAAPQPAPITPPQPEPPKPQPLPKPPEPKVKPVVKPVVKKTPPKPVDNAPAPKAAESAPAPAVEAALPSNAPPVSAPAAPARTEEVTEASFRADYLQNPKPNYPMTAKSRGWQGKVLLRVLVSAAGNSAKVEVERSSGHEILDDQAVETVKTWKFVPAKRGDAPIESSVIVPIIFSLSD